MRGSICRAPSSTAWSISSRAENSQRAAAAAHARPRRPARVDPPRARAPLRHHLAAASRAGWSAGERTGDRLRHPRSRSPSLPTTSTTTRASSSWPRPRSRAFEPRLEDPRLDGRARQGPRRRWPSGCSAFLRQDEVQDADPLPDRAARKSRSRSPSCPRSANEERQPNAHRRRRNPALLLAGARLPAGRPARASPANIPRSPAGSSSSPTPAPIRTSSGCSRPSPSRPRGSRRGSTRTSRDRLRAARHPLPAPHLPGAFDVGGPLRGRPRTRQAHQRLPHPGPHPALRPGADGQHLPLPHRPRASSCGRSRCSAPSWCCPRPFRFLERDSDVAQVLRIRLDAPALPFYALDAERLRFLLQADRGWSPRCSTRSVMSQVLRGGAAGRRQRADRAAEQRDHPGGQRRKKDEVLPFPPHAQPAYRLLHEYFAFPEKFHFFDLNGFERVRAGRRLDLLLLLDRTPQGRPAPLGRTRFALGCTPIVNLFPRTSEPIRWDQKKLEYLLVPDNRRHRTTEIHSIKRSRAPPIRTSRPGSTSPSIRSPTRCSSGSTKPSGTPAASPPRTLPGSAATSRSPSSTSTSSRRSRPTR